MTLPDWWQRRLKLPLIAAPMFLISGPDLVIAACKAGATGCFPTPNARDTDILEQWLARISEEVTQADAPWAVNLVVHRTNNRLEADLALCERYRAPIVITALGSPKPALEVVHGYGGVVLADVVNLRLAKKAADAGVDGLACVSAGAGGHTGWMSPFAFVRALREFFDGIVVIGGGIADGYSVAGATMAGADLVYMGTRFIPTEESMASPAYKQMLIDSTAEDLVISSGITGTPASWLKPSLRAAGLDPDDLPPTPPRNYDSNRSFTQRKWVDTWTAGQGLGAIKRISPVAAVVDELEREYWEAARLWRRFGQRAQETA